MKNLILLIILVFSFSCSTDELEKDGYDKDGNSYDGPIETITHNGVDRKYIIILLKVMMVIQNYHFY